MTRSGNSWANFIGFQLVWLATVAGAGNGLWWAGVPVLALFAAWQYRVSRVPRADCKLVVLAAVLGFGVDSAFAASRWLEYSSAQPSAQLAPVWIIVLWMGFALTLNHSMQFLRGRYLLAILLGALSGPLAYLAAERLWGAVRFEAPQGPVLLALAIAWAVVTPLLVAISLRWASAENPTAAGAGA